MAAETLSKLVRALHSIDQKWDALDMLDTLWLASRLNQQSTREKETGDTVQRTTSEKKADAEAPNRNLAVEKAREKKRESSAKDTRNASQSKDYIADLPYRGAYAVDGKPDGNPTRLVGRGGSPLASQLDYLRALRPLKRLKSSRTRRVLDEVATAELSADYGLLIPQMRPANERWLTLNVVIDNSPSMAIWHATLRQLKLLLLKSGVFHRIAFWSWDTQAKLEESAIGCDWPLRGRIDRKPSALSTIDGRQLVLIVSDAIADGWRDRRAISAIEQWSRHASVALLPTLPSRFWSRTGLADADPALIFATGPAINSFDLYCVPRRRSQLRNRDRSHASRKLTIEQWRNRRPVIPISAIQPQAFSRLTHFIAALGMDPVAGICLPTRHELIESSAIPEAADSPEIPPHELLQAFNATASPEARQLARYLAAMGYFSLEVIRLIRQSLVPNAHLHDEAEVLFSGISQVLIPNSDPEKVIYGFLEPIRKSLRGDLTVQKTYQIVQRVFGFWAKAAGIDANSLELLLRKSQSGDSLGRVGDDDALAPIAAEVLSSLRPVTSGAQSKSADPTEKVRKPRLQITYEQEIIGAVIKKELPAVIGVLAELSGDHVRLPSLPLRNFVEINRENFDAVLLSTGVELNLDVAWLLSPGEVQPSTHMKVALKFESLSDFEPINIVLQCEPTRRVFEIRQHFSRLLESLESKHELKRSLTTLLSIRTGLGKAKEPHRSDQLHWLLPQWDDELDASTRADIFRPVVQATGSEEAADGLLNDFAVALHQLPPSPNSGLVDYVELTIKLLDGLLSRQLAAIMHHEKFQQLEGTWRGLHFLVHKTETGQLLKIRVLNVSKREIARDFDSSLEFDNTALFKKIYEETFHVPGGEPFTILVGDYCFSSSAADVDLLSRIAKIAAASFAPFIAAAGPEYFGLDSYAELNSPRDLMKLMETPDKAILNGFRRSEDARFVVLTCPRVLARIAYGNYHHPISEFHFEERKLQADGTYDALKHHEYCWMSSAWSFAFCVARSFSETGYFENIRGRNNGGCVEGLPVAANMVEEGSFDVKCTEVDIPDRRELELSKCGVMSLCHYKYSDLAVFFSGTTLAQPYVYEHEDATENAAISTRLPAILTTSRFVHYLMVISRSVIGSFREPADLESYLNNWVLNYVSTGENPTEFMQSRYPLHEASVEVASTPGRPGSLQAVFYVRPRLSFEELRSALKIRFLLPSALR